MRVATVLLALYPPAVRHRWGPAIADEVAVGGPSCWFDTTAGAARLWMRPGDWPESVVGETRRVIVVMTFAITAVSVLVLRATGRPASALSPDPGYAAMAASLLLLALGIGLASPLPRRQPGVIGRLVRISARALAGPGLAVLALVIVANSGIVDHPGGLLRLLLLAWYWATLAYVGLSLCALIAHLAPLGREIDPRRLRLALLLMAAGLLLTAGQALASLRAAPGAAAVVSGTALITLAAIALTLGLNLPTGNERVP